MGVELESLEARCTTGVHCCQELASIRKMKKSMPRELRRAPKPKAVPGTTIEQERAATLAAIRSAPDRATLEKALRPAICVFTKRVADDVPNLGASHMGGWPDLPAEVQWPRVEGRFPMTFIGQIRLEEVARLDLDRVLPHAGLLSFFLYDMSPPDVADAPQWYSRHRVMWTPDVSTLRRVDAPEELFAEWIARDRRGPAATAEVRFHVVFELPSHATTQTKLLGYDPDNVYDVPFAPGTRNLFRCESDDQTALEFGDAQDIAFRISDEDLRARRFDKTTLSLQIG